MSLVAKIVLLLSTVTIVVSHGLEVTNPRCSVNVGTFVVNLTDLGVLRAEIPTITGNVEVAAYWTISLCNVVPGPSPARQPVCGASGYVQLYNEMECTKIFSAMSSPPTLNTQGVVTATYTSASGASVVVNVACGGTSSKMEPVPESTVIVTGTAPHLVYTIPLQSGLLCPAPAPPPPAPTTTPAVSCASTVATYWSWLIKGNMSTALTLVTSNVLFSWPGDHNVLPMAGKWIGPTGIEDFFGQVFTYFDFELCRAPHVTALTDPAFAGKAYVNWEECSFLKGTSIVPCPNLLNQALYTCDPTGAKIVRIDVSLDTSCVAAALCTGKNTTLQC